MPTWEKRTFWICLLFSALLGLAGRGQVPSLSAAEPPKAEEERAEKVKKSAEPVPVSGAWSGRWESAMQKGHGGGLTCEISSSGKDEWNATFTAEFGKTKSYQVPLKGKQEGDAVVFGGSVNIGKEAGEGLFQWSGRATATEFVGGYEGGGDKGTFKMIRPAKGAAENYKMLYSSFTDGPFKPGEWIIKTEEEWQELFQACEMEAHKKLQGEQHDFTKYVLVAFAPGALTYVPTEDSGVKEVSILEKGIVVSYTIKNSGVRVFKGIQPLYVVRILKTDKPVSFLKKVDAE